jgi:hypothetical protein
MSMRVILVNLAIAVSLTVGLSYIFARLTFHLLDYGTQIIALCIVLSLLYPIALRLTHSAIGYAKGLLILLLVFLAALAYSEAVYYSRMEAIHHDFGEAFPILVILLVILELVSSSFYTIGYFASRRFLS